jgi:hypothetical protein
MSISHPNSGRNVTEVGRRLFPNRLPPDHLLQRFLNRPSKKPPIKRTENPKPPRWPSPERRLHNLYSKCGAKPARRSKKRKRIRVGQRHRYCCVCRKKLHSTSKGFFIQTASARTSVFACAKNANGSVNSLKPCCGGTSVPVADTGSEKLQSEREASQDVCRSDRGPRSCTVGQ